MVANDKPPFQVPDGFVAAKNADGQWIVVPVGKPGDVPTPQPPKHGSMQFEPTKLNSYFSVVDTLLHTVAGLVGVTTHIPHPDAGKKDGAGQVIAPEGATIERDIEEVANEISDAAKVGEVLPGTIGDIARRVDSVAQEVVRLSRAVDALTSGAKGIAPAGGEGA